MFIEGEENINLRSQFNENIRKGLRFLRLYNFYYGDTESGTNGWDLELAYDTCFFLDNMPKSELVVGDELIKYGDTFIPVCKDSYQIYDYLNYSCNDLRFSNDPNITQHSFNHGFEKNRSSYAFLRYQHPETKKIHWYKPLRSSTCFLIFDPYYGLFNCDIYQNDLIPGWIYHYNYKFMELVRKVFSMHTKFYIGHITIGGTANHEWGLIPSKLNSSPRPKKLYDEAKSKFNAVNQDGLIQDYNVAERSPAAIKQAIDYHLEKFKTVGRSNIQTPNRIFIYFPSLDRYNNDIMNDWSYIKDTAKKIDKELEQRFPESRIFTVYEEFNRLYWDYHYYSFYRQEISSLKTLNEAEYYSTARYFIYWAGLVYDKSLLVF